jgi:hypothetical protein
MKVVIVLLVIFACSSLARELFSLHDEDRHRRYVFEIPESAYDSLSTYGKYFFDTLSNKSLREQEYPDAKFHFTATSYKCIIDLKDSYVRSEFNVDVDPYNRNNTQKVAYRADEFAAEFVVSYMEDEVSKANVVYMFIGNSMACYAQAWTLDMTQGDKTARRVALAYPTYPQIDIDPTTILISRGREVETEGKSIQYSSIIDDIQKDNYLDETHIQI